MNDEAARQGRPDDYAQRSRKTVAAPRVVIEIPLESKMRPRIVADSREDEIRFRGWFRAALKRRMPLSDELVRWLEELDEREAA
jgi:hypothetical protein